MHGHWSDPDSVVLGNAGHASISAEKAIASLVEAVSYSYTLVLIGFGAALDAPHFAPLRSWLTSSPGDRAIRLISAHEAGLFSTDALAEERKHIDLVEYGQGFDDLVPFLRGLAVDRADSTGIDEALPAEETHGPWWHPFAAAFATPFAVSIGVLPLLEKSGVVSVLSAVCFGIGGVFVYMLGWRRQTGCSWAGAAAFLILGLILVFASGDGPSDLNQGVEGAVPPPSNTETTAPGEGPTTLPQTVAQPVATDAAPAPLKTDELRAPRKPPAAGEVGRSTEWGEGPDSRKVLGLDVTIGEIGLADDGEDIMERLLLRAGQRRCPARGYWRDVRTGDKFELTTPKRRYSVIIKGIEFPSSFDTDTERSVRRTTGGSGCRRS